MSALVQGFTVYDDIGNVIKTFYLPLFKLDATADPTVAADETLGYAPGSHWINKTTNKEFVCTKNATGAAVWVETTSGGSGGPPTGAAGGDLGGTYPNPTVAQASGAWALTGDISPTALAANTNDYNPTGLSTAAIIRVDQVSSHWDLTGLQGGADGRVIILQNVSTRFLTLRAESASSTAANRFKADEDIVVDSGNSIALIYDSTSSRWRVLYNGGAPQGIAYVLAQAGDARIPNALTLAAGSNISLTSSLGTYTIAVTGAIPIGNGGTGQVTQTAAFNALDPLTTKGDLIVNNGTDSIRLPVGTDGQVVTADSTQAAGVKWATPSAGSGGPDIQVFTSNGTWTKPAGKTVAHRIVIGGGGGGGSGRRRASGSIGFGGGGGQGGYFSEDFVNLSLLGATEAVVVGTGGVGGTPAALSSTNGGLGGQGGLSSFGTINTASYMAASGGDGGAGGSTVSGAGGNNATGNGQAAGGAGGASGAGATAAAGGSPVTGPFGKAAGGGGGGGGLNAANVVATGALGGFGSAGQQPAATSAANGLAAAAGSYTPGSGGNGSDGSAGAGVAGGAGGFPGGGGGGNGANTNGGLSAAGGAGADGIVVVISW